MPLPDPLNQTNRFSTPEGGIDYEALSGAVTETAGRTRNVGAPAFPEIAEIPHATAVETQMADALRQSYEGQVGATQQQAGQAATALEVTGAATENYLRNLEGIATSSAERQGQSLARWNQVTEQADEYVTEARERVGTALATLDEINRDIGENRNFARSHDLQAATQAALGVMNEEGRKISETYGMESNEYRQFTASRRGALATAFSNVAANYLRLQETQDLTFLSATNEAMLREDMYASYQEQQHVETLRYLAASQDALDLSYTQFQIEMEGLKVAGMENFANWLVATPAYAMDLTPFVAGILNIEATAQARFMAEEENRRADEEAAKVPTLYMVNRGGIYNDSWTWGMGSGGLRRT